MSDTTGPKPAVLAAVVAGALVVGAFVFRAPSSGPTAEWTPADHDTADLPANAGRAPAPPRQAPQPTGAAGDSDDLVELAWAKNCATCHGPAGKGDGPQGPMLRAPDLTRAELQDRASDDDLRAVIRNGRNNMPKFDLPPAVLDGLVKRIRANRAR